MARDHARLRLAIWDDPDWTSLTSLQQLAYLALISSSDLSYAGVVPYLPSRYAHLASDWTERKFAVAVAALEARRFVVVDRATAEILVRSYVRHDGLAKQPNVMKALVKAYLRIHSETLKEVVAVELGRLLGETPDARGWDGFREASPELFATIEAKANRKGSAKGSPKDSPKGSATPLPPSPFPSSSSLRSVTRDAANG